ncbi:MAG: 5-formyltetrahydrofolate cyclo-ligase [Sulfuritalea sp.]|nr:5-formyltetrahydrofolate cyclo-ligase [Sulfuritalea sp.]
MDSTNLSPKHIADYRVFRATLRQEKLAARLALDSESHAALSARIEARLAALLMPLPAQTLAFCAPFRGEFDARPLASLLIERDWRVAMPIIETNDTPMRFRGWTPTCAMDVDQFGIPIPAGGNTLVPNIILLPLVAFDPQGYRLGYGGGYFDRTLAAMVPRPLAIGVGFEFARVDDIGPQPHDIRLDAVVTETGIEHHARVP